MDRVEVHKTGPASAGPHGIAVSGNANITLGPVVRSAYLEQVARIAPPELVGRDTELADLAAFCTEPGQGGYVWWRASAWSGKSALLAWFVLHPPAGIRVVSFFVTARYANQNDRVAFTDAVTEQLAGMLGQPMPAHLTEATRDTHFLGLLREAAQACQRQGERLVLVVDGLDEDRGVSGPSGHSIAGLLPVSPPAGTRVVVAGRANPPVPPDVAGHHPLHDPAIVRPLGVSPRATAARKDMERELDQLLKGTPAEQDLLGLVVAAGGGLSGPDLAELTGWTQWRVTTHLNTVAGRSFTPRRSRWQPGAAPDLYVLGHEELQKTAVTVLGPERLANYRQRLHVWADRHRAQRWPAGTPEYLLRGYHRMLHATGEMTRMLVYATDQARHERMLDVTGGDVTALTEITTTMDAVTGQDDPDLHATARLAVHRDHLTRRNASIPPELPAVWAQLGHHDRAENLAHFISDPCRRAQSLAKVAEALAAVGEHNRATALADWAETVARSAVSEYSPDEALPRSLARVARALVAAGEPDRAAALADRAETFARSITSPYRQERALAGVAVALAAVGEPDRAENLARSLGPSSQAEALAGVARALAAAGEPDRAASLADRAETAAPPLTRPYYSQEALAGVAVALAAVGNHDRAMAVAGLITDQSSQAEALAGVAGVLAAAGEPDRAAALADRAETVARSLTRPYSQEALAGVAVALAAAGEPDRAENLARSIINSFSKNKVLAGMTEALVACGEPHRAETVAHSITDQSLQAEPLAAVAEALAAAGEPDRAENLARSIGDVDRQIQALARVAVALASAGEHDRAEIVAGSITKWSLRAQALARVAEALAGAGEHDRAAALADRAETVARSLVFRSSQAEPLARVATALAAAGEHDRAEVVARSIGDPLRQAEVVAVAVGLANAGEHDRAENLARSIEKEEALVAVAEALAGAGEYDRAENLARSIGHPYREALVAVAEGLAGAGEYDRAENLARSIRHPSRRAEALVAVAGHVERARARRIVAWALRIGDWTTALGALPRVQPAVILTVADEYLSLDR